AFVPALRTKLPRPGRWMDRLKRFLAIPMAASAFAALWLLDRTAGERALIIGAALSVGLSFAAFEAGRLQRRSKPGAWGSALAALVLVGVGVAVVPQRTTSSHSGAASEQWSEARVASLAQQGRPVFVYFTADWCLTCKVNEAAAIDRSEVRDAFGKAGVKV